MKTISLVADIITIFAFILAYVEFRRWKEEAKYAKKLEYILDLEDKFEILINDILNDFKFFSDLDKCLIDIDDKSNEYKKQMDSFIKQEFEKYKNNSRISKSFYEYSLALNRVKRFINDIEKQCNKLNYDFLKELNEEAIILTPKWKNENDISEKSKDYLEKIQKIQKNVISYIRSLYR